MDSLVQDKKPKSKHSKEPYWGRAYDKMNKQFKLEIPTHNWDNMYNSLDPNEALGLFKSDFINILDKYAAYKNFNSRQDRLPRVCTEYLEATHERNTESKISKQTNSMEDKLENK